MGIGSMASWRRWSLPLQSPHRRPSQRHPSSWRGREASFESGKPIQNLILEGGELLHKHSLKGYACSYEALQSIESISADVEEDVKINNERKSYGGFSYLSKPISMMGDDCAYLASLTSTSPIQFSLLMENLNKIEDLLAGTDLVRLERDIMVHIRRLGALKLFHACLSRTPSTVHPNFLHAEHFKDCPADFATYKPKHKIIVRSGKKEERRLKRIRTSDKADKMSDLSVSSERLHKVEESTSSPYSSSRRSMDSTESRNRRSLVARNESEMSKGVKEVANLERIRIKLEEEIGRGASYTMWAEAAGIDEKTLQQRLQYGWYCRDKLIKSARSLVVYIARNYRGMGMAFDDLLQAGNVGLLKGAERFDNTRGYQFSTYVQYWIRKSLLALVAHHSKGIHVPVRMEKTIKGIQKARRTFCNREGRYPQDEEIAELTGISLANVRLARKCSRAVGSIDKEMGDGWRTTFMEVTADPALKPPDEIITRQHMRKDIGELLEGLHPREKQVLVLRYGLEDGRCMSLGEIGSLSRVTKEWIRKIEKTALSKIRSEDIQRELKHYLNS